MSLAYQEKKSSVVPTDAVCCVEFFDMLKAQKTFVVVCTTAILQNKTLSMLT